MDDRSQHSSNDGFPKGGHVQAKREGFEKRYGRLEPTTELLQLAIGKLELNGVLIITGPRRAGKSALAQRLLGHYSKKGFTPRTFSKKNRLEMLTNPVPNEIVLCDPFSETPPSSQTLTNIAEKIKLWAQNHKTRLNSYFVVVINEKCLNETASLAKETRSLYQAHALNITCDHRTDEEKSEELQSNDRAPRSLTGDRNEFYRSSSRENEAYKCPSCQRSQRRPFLNISCTLKHRADLTVCVDAHVSDGLFNLQLQDAQLMGVGQRTWTTKLAVLNEVSASCLYLRLETMKGEHWKPCVRNSGEPVCPTVQCIRPETVVRCEDPMCERGVKDDLSSTLSWKLTREEQGQTPFGCVVDASLVVGDQEPLWKHREKKEEFTTLLIEDTEYEEPRREADQLHSGSSDDYHAPRCTHTRQLSSCLSAFSGSGSPSDVSDKRSDTPIQQKQLLVDESGVHGSLETKATSDFSQPDGNRTKPVSDAEPGVHRAQTFIELRQVVPNGNEESPVTSEDDVNSVRTAVEKKGLQEGLKTRLAALEHHPFPEAYDRPYKYSGACPTFRKKLMQLREATTSQDFEYLLEGKDSSEKDAIEIVQYWAVSSRKGKQPTDNTKMIVLASTTLIEDIGLPVPCAYPERKTTQMVFLGQGLPFFVLVLFEEGRLESEAPTVQNEMRKFAVELARALTSALLNVCGSDFVILPCKLERRKLSVNILENEVTEQRDFASGYFRGPKRISASSFDDLKAALAAVARVTSVPYFLHDPDCKQLRQLLLFDVDWYSVLTFVIEMMSKRGNEELTYTVGSEFKVKAAVIEAVRRFSFRTQIVVVTDIEKIHSCVRRVVEQEQKTHRLDLKLRVTDLQSLSTEIKTPGTEQQQPAETERQSDEAFEDLPKNFKRPSFESDQQSQTEQLAPEEQPLPTEQPSLTTEQKSLDREQSKKDGKQSLTPGQQPRNTRTQFTTPGQKSAKTRKQSMRAGQPSMRTGKQSTRPQSTETGKQSLKAATEAPETRNLPAETGQSPVSHLVEKLPDGAQQPMESTHETPDSQQRNNGQMPVKFVVVIDPAPQVNVTFGTESREGHQKVLCVRMANE